MSINIERCIQVCSLVQIFGDTRRGEAAELAAKELEQLKDDPSLDATDAAHPAWWRGQEAASKVWAARVEKLEQTIKQLQRGKQETIERAGRVPGLTATLDEVQFERDKLRVELKELRTMLALGQCVDLSKLDDLDLHASPIERGCQRLRDWLIEKAGVKP